MKFKHRVKLLTAGLGLAIASVSPVASATDTQQAALEYAVKAQLAEQSLLLGGVSIGDKLIVAGSRGHILLSNDQGRTWTQARVPARVALTSIFFANEKHGWAVGHDAVILRTEDGGETWERTHYAPEEERPLLDIWFKDDARTGYAYGAYGYVLKSNDGGRTWTNIGIGNEDGEPDDYHLNSIAKSKNGVLYLAAEAGAAYRSDDMGEQWTRIYVPYEGSFFGVIPLIDDSLLIFGLQGNIFRSDNGGIDWQPIEVETTATLNSGSVLKDGTVVIVGNEGTILVSKTGGYSFVERSLADRKSISSIVPTDDGGALLVGEMGIRKLTLDQLN